MPLSTDFQAPPSVETLGISDTVANVRLRWLYPPAWTTASAITNIVVRATTSAGSEDHTISSGSTTTLDLAIDRTTSTYADVTEVAFTVRARYTGSTEDTVSPARDYQFRPADTQPGSEVYFTSSEPEVDSRLVGHILVLSVKRLPGAQEYQVLLNNRLSPTTYVVGDSPTEQLRIPITSDMQVAGYVTYAVRGRAYGGDQGVQLDLGNGETFAVPAFTYVYSLYSATTSVALDTSSDALPDALVTVPTPDTRVENALQDAIGSFNLVRPDIIDQTDTIWLTLLALALSAGVAGIVFATTMRGSITPPQMAATGIIFVICWSLGGPLLLGIPWTVALPPLVLLLIAGLLMLKQRMG